MTTTVTLCVLGVLSALGFTVATALPPQTAGDIPWKDLAGGGASVLLVVAFVVFIRFLSQDRAARDTERQKDREHVEKVAAGFQATVQTIHRECQESHERREQELRELAREARRLG